MRNPVLPRGARPSGDRPRGGTGDQCFKARKCETLYSPAGPVRAVTGPAGEYRVLNVLRPISAKPCTPPRGPSDRRHIFLFAKGKIRSGPDTTGLCGFVWLFLMCPCGFKVQGLGLGFRVQGLGLGLSGFRFKV